MCKQSENGFSFLCLVAPWVAFHLLRMVDPLSLLLHLYKLPPALMLSTPIVVSSLEGDKVSMLTYTYTLKPLRKIEVTICESPG